MDKGNLSLRTVKFRVLIPQNYNDGRPVDPALLEFIEDVFVSIAGGWSSPGLVRGAWLDADGECRQDINRVYEIGVAPELMHRLSRLVRAIGQLLKQHSVYYEIDRSTQICIEPVHPQTLVHATAAPVDASKNGRATTMLQHNGKGA